MGDGHSSILWCIAWAVVTVVLRIMERHFAFKNEQPRNIKEGMMTQLSITMKLVFKDIISAVKNPATVILRLLQLLEMALPFALAHFWVRGVQRVKGVVRLANS